MFPIRLCFFACIFSAFSVNSFSQSQLSPEYSVDGTIYAMATKGDTIIAAGSFNNAGIYSGGDALLTAANDKPNLSFPKVIGTVVASSPDGAGGFYICGNFKKESETGNAFYRIEHVLANFSYEPGFSFTVSALFGINKILFHNGLLYIAGSYVDNISGQPAGDLSALNVTTGQLVPWIPSVTHNNLGGVYGLFISQNTLYITGNFNAVAATSRKNIAAVRIGTGALRSWNFAGNWPDAKSYNDIVFYQNKMIIAGGIDDGGDVSVRKHAAAIADTVAGNIIDYTFKSGGIFATDINHLYWAADVLNMTLSGDTLFAFSKGTYDTRVTAVNLLNNNYPAYWAKYFNAVAATADLKWLNGSLFATGNGFTDIYQNNSDNTVAANIEMKIKNAVRISSAAGNLQSWFPNPLGDVSTMSVQGSNILIGGNFLYVKALSRPGIVMMSAATGQVLPFRIELFGQTVNAIKIIDNTLYAAGGYLYINNVYDPKSILAVNLNSGALLPLNTPNLGTAYSIEANGQYIFLGGALAEPAGGAGRTNLFAISRQTGNLSSWSPNPNNYVRALCLYNGKLYAGGDFTSASSQSRSYAASYDTLALSITAWYPRPNSNIKAITANEQAVWIAGSFYNVNDSACSIFAGVDEYNGYLTHKPFTAFTGGAGNALFLKGCYLIAGGNFRLSNVEACNNLALYNMYDHTLSTGANFCINIEDLAGSVNALTANGNDVYFGGAFTKTNGYANASNIERIRFPANYFSGCGQYRTVQNGLWSNPLTWETSTVPPPDANVLIRHSVTVSANASCFSLRTSIGGSLTVSPGIILATGH